MTNKPSNGVANAILELSDDLHSLGMIDGPTHEKITLRHLGKGARATAEPISSEEIRGLREKAHSAKRRSPAI